MGYFATYNALKISEVAELASLQILLEISYCYKLSPSSKDFLISYKKYQFSTVEGLEDGKRVENMILQMLVPLRMTILIQSS